jgi:hypothetical protein
VTGPGGNETLQLLLAWVHPVWMLASIGLAFAALRVGLRLRQARLARRRRRPEDRPLHLRLAKPAVWLICAGFGLGLASAVWLRGLHFLANAHGLVASTALALFVATGILGWRLEHGRSRARDAHALVAVLALLAAVAAFGTGLVLLP